jgi:hypothetical protein
MARVMVNLTQCGGEEDEAVNRRRNKCSVAVLVGLRMERRKEVEHEDGWCDFTLSPFLGWSIF